MGLTAALAIGGALAGAKAGADKRKAQQRFNRGQAEITRNSDFGAAGPGKISPVTASAFGGALQGGISGAKFGQQFGGGAPTQGALSKTPIALNTGGAAQIQKATQPRSFFQDQLNPNRNQGLDVFGRTS